MYNLHHKLARLDGVDHVLAESLLLDCVGKRLGNLVVDVGVDKGATHVFKGFGNVDFGDSSLAFEKFEASFKAIAEFFEHDVLQAVCGSVGEYYFGRERACFFGRHGGIGHYDDDVAGLHHAGCRAVEAYCAFTSFSGYGVGVEAGAVIVVHYIYALTGKYAGRVEEVFVDGDASDIVEASLGHGHTVYFRLEDLNKHFVVGLIPDIVN